METNDPNPKVFHGNPPGVMVASLGGMVPYVLDAAVGSTPGTQVYYFHNDHLGTPQVITDESGAVVWKADYDPFGQANPVVQVIENNFRFPGQYFDEETGLHQNWHREYAPGLGRYVEADPIGIRGALALRGHLLFSGRVPHLYAYCLDDPLNWFDLFGLQDLGKQIQQRIRWQMEHSGLKESNKPVSWTGPTPELTKGEKIAIAKGLSGAGLIIAGVYTPPPHGPRILAAGIILSHEAFVLLLAEFGFGADTGAIPSWWELLETRPTEDEPEKKLCKEKGGKNRQP